MNFKIIYRESIIKMFKSGMTYAALVVSLLISAFVMIFIPLIGTQMDMPKYYDSTSWTESVCQGTFSVFALSAALIGETNAISSEKIYFLSKPLKRTTFLLAKCIATLTIAFIVAFACFVILLGIAIWLMIKYDNNIFSFKKCVNPFGLFGSWISILLFSSFVATIWKYQSRGGVWIMLCFALVLIYAIIFPMYANITDSDFSKTERFWWLMIPVILYLPLGTVLSLIGANIFIKSEIES
ncbi:MAG: hypothetical protein LBT17_02095 [Mycoplasmataceae bacterium]|nr:hypothetical protein [Mycoplasmataceae bacterium]